MWCFRCKGRAIEIPEVWLVPRGHVNRTRMGARHADHPVRVTVGRLVCRDGLRTRPTTEALSEESPTGDDVTGFASEIGLKFRVAVSGKARWALFGYRFGGVRLGIQGQRLHAIETTATHCRDRRRRVLVPAISDPAGQLLTWGFHQQAMKRAGSALAVVVDADYRGQLGPGRFRVEPLGHWGGADTRRANQRMRRRATHRGSGLGGPVRRSAAAGGYAVVGRGAKGLHISQPIEWAHDTTTYSYGGTQCSR